MENWLFLVILVNILCSKKSHPDCSAWKFLGMNELKGPCWNILMGKKKPKKPGIQQQLKDLEFNEWINEGELLLQREAGSHSLNPIPVHPSSPFPPSWVWFLPPNPKAALNEFPAITETHQCSPEFSNELYQVSVCFQKSLGFLPALGSPLTFCAICWPFALKMWNFFS